MKPVQQCQNEKRQLEVVGLTVKNILLCQYAHITRSCGEYEHRLQNHKKIVFTQATISSCFIYPIKGDNETYFTIFVYMSVLFYVSQ
jgi:hypothetical protein